MKNILEYLERSAERFPDKTAFADENTACTFAELRERARRAGSFFASRDLHRRPVPVLMEKSVLTISVMMGIVYGGGFYVILDAAQPADRLNRILETLSAKYLVTEPGTEDIAGGLRFDGEILKAEELVSGETDEAALERIRRASLDIDPLYVLFTSGSTGMPKGVVVCHRSVIDFIDVFTELFGITEKDVIGNQAPWDFDVSVKDIYGGLAAGASVHLIPQKLFSAPVMLMDFLEERGVTNLTWAVSALVIVSTLNVLEYKAPASVKRILFSGETIPVRHLNYWRSYYPDALFVNLYGPTEITCNCTYYILDREFQPGDVLPIGQAFPNESVFLLDEENRLVDSAGKNGEICVSGTALALGYYHNPEQTAKAFVQNPLNPDFPETVYRTGDLAFYNEKGELCFASRKDFQIKHMGHRIELGEIEAALEKIPEITRSCCLFDEEKNKIVCFYEGGIDRKNLKLQAARYLPQFMLPNVVRQMDRLPITKNGKIDRKLLKESLHK